jgi:hypothetical protein
MWSWWTLTEGNHNAALKHVWQAFKHEPFNTKSETWRLHHSRPLIFCKYIAIATLDKK